MDKNYFSPPMWYVDGLDEIENSNKKKVTKKSAGNSSNPTRTKFKQEPNDISFVYDKTVEKTLIKKYASSVNKAKNITQVLSIVFFIISFAAFFIIGFIGIYVIAVLIAIVLFIVSLNKKKKIKNIKMFFENCSKSDLKTLYLSNEPLVAIAPGNVNMGNSNILITLYDLPIVPKSVKSIIIITRRTNGKEYTKLDLTMQNNKHIIIPESGTNDATLINAITAINPNILMSVKTVA